MRNTIYTLNKLIGFKLDKTLLNWWKNQSSAAKLSFISALIIGFVSHIFIYTGRYYGRDDLGIIVHAPPIYGTGRWMNNIISELSFGYVIPLVSGLFVTFFLAVSALLICRIFNINNKMNAVLVAGLITAFPSIANTNLFLYDTPNYHFAVMLAVIAVYITLRFKFGFLAGGILAMCTLAIYQSKFNVILSLSLFYLITLLLDDQVELKDIIKKKMLRLAAMIGIGSIFYVISLPLSFYISNTTFNNYRGMSPESISERLLSFSGIFNALKSTYQNFYKGFFGNMYLNVKSLKLIYILIFIMILIFIAANIINKYIYLRLIIIAPIVLLIPLACNFSDFFDSADAYGLMIYAFVIPLVFSVVISEKCTNIFPVIKSIFALCMIFVIVNYIIGNNVYYLKAYYYNQRTYSLTTRLLDKIDPLLTKSESKKITFFGTLPNEYYRESKEVFREYGIIKDGSSLGSTSFISYNAANINDLMHFANNIERFHGVRLTPLSKGDEWYDLKDKVLSQNMPSWPAEGSVAIVDDIIVVNLGVTDIVLEEDDSGQYFRARHWKSDVHADHEYKYKWQVYKNGELIESPTTESDRLYVDMSNYDDKYEITVIIKNTNIKFDYPKVSSELQK